jgi:hypothetical protein
LTVIAGLDPAIHRNRRRAKARRFCFRPYPQTVSREIYSRNIISPSASREEDVTRYRSCAAATAANEHYPKLWPDHLYQISFRPDLRQIISEKRDFYLYFK